MLVTGEERSFTIAVELVRATHKVCPYSNATRGNIEITLSANGAAVEIPPPAALRDQAGGGSRTSARKPVRCASAVR